MSPLRLRRRLSSPRSRCGGFSLVEVMISVAVLTVSTFMVTSTLVSAAQHRGTKLEAAMAAEAARNILEQMHSEDFTKLFVRYNESPLDDPGPPLNAPGCHFDVPGLKPLTADTDQHVGRILMPSPGPELIETTISKDLGMPRDLNGDAIVDDANHATNYIVLPVTVRVEWMSENGPRNFQLSTMFAKLLKAPK